MYYSAISTRQICQRIPISLYGLRKALNKGRVPRPDLVDGPRLWLWSESAADQVIGILKKSRRAAP
jgi:predicted DNA-binding transcriptional regulator AlpA